jgi:hypothetical protein
MIVVNFLTFIFFVFLFFELLKAYKKFNSLESEVYRKISDKSPRLAITVRRFYVLLMIIFLGMALRIVFFTLKAL